MSIESTHPEYDAKATKWRLMRDTYEGEEAVKFADFLYLPATAGQRADGAATKALTSLGWISYDAYKARAQFPELVQEAVNTLVGVMHQEAAVIDLPPEMEGMRENATREGESLIALLRRINEQQLLRGRIGLLADFPQSGEEDLPHVVPYEAESILNWDDERFEEMEVDKLSLLVVNETGQVRGLGTDVFQWTVERRFRAAFLDDFTGEYTTFTEVEGITDEPVVPTFRGTTLQEIPFVFIGANDLSARPDDIPLLSVAEGAIHLYKQSADYRQTLHTQGQDTLIIIGSELKADGSPKDETDDTRVGSGAVIRIDDGGDAKFVGVNGEGLGEQRQSYQNDLNDTRAKGPRLLEGRKGQAESGEALTVRVSASTASVKQIALTGAAGLQSILRMIARWIGADENLVLVRPNTDFSQAQPEPRLLNDYQTARKEGAPLSEQSMHAWAQRQNFTKMTFEEEMSLVEAERQKRMDQALAIAQATQPAPDEDAGDSSDEDETDE